MVAAYGGAGTVWVLLLGAYFTYNRRVGNFFPTFLGDVIIVYDAEGIGAIYSFSSAILVVSDALVEAAYFIGLGLIPDVGEIGMGTELGVVEELSNFLIHNRNGLLGEQRLWCEVLGAVVNGVIVR